MRWISKNWKLLGGAFGFLWSIKDAVLWALDWRGRYDAAIQSYADVGGWQAVIGYIINPPPWFALATAIGGLLLIYWHFRKRAASTPTVPDPGGIDWHALDTAIELYCDHELTGKRDAQIERLHAMLETAAASEKKIRVLQNDPEEHSEEIENERRRMEAANLGRRFCEDELKTIWGGIRDYMLRRLINGEFLAKGIPAPYQPGKGEVMISAPEWRVLQIDPTANTAVDKNNGVIHFVGVIIGKPKTTS